MTDTATQHQRSVVAQAKTWRTPIVEAPAGRRDAFVEPTSAGPSLMQVVVSVKGREPARILIAIGKADRWHLQYPRRWVIQYNFYLTDAEWRRMFVRLFPYFPSWEWIPKRCVGNPTRRRFRAWIFTAVRSRYWFVYPTFEETTARD